MSSSSRLRSTETKKLRTGGDYLHFANRLLKSKGVAHGQGFLNEQEESLTLMSAATGLAWEKLPQCFKRELTEKERSRFVELLDKRIFDRTPTAYLIGEAWLGGLKFKVDERVIIPRSYFVELIPEVIPQWLPPVKSIRRVADICTGSGCLAILLAKYFPNAQVDATDLSSNALEVAKINVKKHKLEKRVHLYKTDTMSALMSGKNYDLIISNPPYEPESVYKKLPEEFKKEPKMSLVSEKDGLGVIRKLLKQAAKKLNSDGLLLIEVGGLRKAMHKNWPKLPMVWLATQDGLDCVCLIAGRDLKRIK
ncbi:MAG: 50S ribosomal protein L3 N(5)-glutamine methyltransferase [Verrucomicrobia bacterium]|nr:50S ribosomal protein L3 N(5)-glutamine methyltransferase [Verrucomicrobiota bacterium]